VTARGEAVAARSRTRTEIRALRAAVHEALCDGQCDGLEPGAPDDEFDQVADLAFGIMARTGEVDVALAAALQLLDDWGFAASARVEDRLRACFERHARRRA
jgi:hypothetical protein